MNLGNLNNFANFGFNNNIQNNNIKPLSQTISNNNIKNVSITDEGMQIEFLVKIIEIFYLYYFIIF